MNASTMAAFFFKTILKRLSCSRCVLVHSDTVSQSVLEPSLVCEKRIHLDKVRMRNAIPAIILLVSSLAITGFADESYVEPGTLRLSNIVTLENVLHRTQPNWTVTNNDLDKTYSRNNNSNPPWSSEWGESLLTEAATRVTPDIFGRVLFEAQGDYADRYWRPNNIEHEIDNADRHIFVRQAEARIDRDEWYAHAYEGVAHGNWADKGDLFGLYPESVPNDDYLGRSGYFGMTPQTYNQDMFFNISKRRAPRGFEAGAQADGIDATVAYGNELRWGYDTGGYGRAAMPLGPSKMTFVYKNEDVPYGSEPNERDRAYSLSLFTPSITGNSIDFGVLYRPFRVGQTYLVDREVDGGQGLLGSSHQIGTKTSKTSEAFAEKVQGILHTLIAEHDVAWNAGLTHADVLAGNKQELDLGFNAELTSMFRASVQYMYRKPIEGPIPFLYEGTPDNIGSVAASPRGPDDPFRVDWDNRQATFLTTTFVIDPTPATSLMVYKPDTFQFWNVNPREDSKIAAAVQYRVRDYPTTTDRLSYIDANGNYTSDPPAHSGAWATSHPIQDFRLLFVGHPKSWSWSFGIAGGQDLAYQGLAYSNDSSVNKPITEYYSLEARIDWAALTVWGNYGTGVWGPEAYQQDFGESFDRLYGLGASYKITTNTTIDVSYLAARQDDNMFVAPDLGSYNEIRTLFSHRFGFIFQFSDAAQAGYRAR